MARHLRGSAADETLEFGSGSMIPGFEEGLSGMTAVGKEVLDVTFPDDYQQRRASEGRSCSIRIQLKAVKADGACAPAMRACSQSYGVEEGGEETFPRRSEEKHGARAS